MTKVYSRKLLILLLVSLFGTVHGSVDALGRDYVLSEADGVEIQPVEKTGSKPKVGVKVGATLMDYSIFAPQFSFSLLNIGGSPVGVGVGAYKCIGQNHFGADLSLFFRLTKSVYLSAGPGVFTSSINGGSTQGISGMAGIDVILGKHLCIGAGVKYFPKVEVNATKSINTMGAYYDFPSVVEALHGGVFPVLSFGYVF